MNSNPMDLTGKTCIVTGGGRGIGKAIAASFLDAGANVVIAGRKRESLDAALAEFAEPAKTLAIECHVGKVDQIARLISAARERFSRIDVLVNNAATNIARAPTVEVTDDAFAKMVEINVLAAFRMVRAVVPEMAERGSGSILNITSVAGLRSEGSGIVYGATKAMLNHLTAGWARELGPRGIRVNAIAPGLIRTEFSAALWQDASLSKHILSQQALAGLATPDAIGPLAAFLVSDAAKFITGQVIVADGGLIL